MSVFEFREYIESLIPWYVPFIIPIASLILFTILSCFKVIK